MSIDRTNFVTVLRTGQLVHLDWACNALDEADVPYQRREETSGGIRLAMPVAPSVGPGTWWTVLVPERFAGRAHEVLAGLPFEQTTTPDVWSFQPRPAVKLGWQIYAAVVGGAILIGFVVEIIRHFR
jgi:hypothetical protein